ncbi:hypothetical protein Pcinc_034014 [Petrolisthes cinctipes]|uniref:Uncharacterized protein n=1 Tax=Petrolisthes cinctipes TaxID=88211 RepID=A0AAE1ER18_PETCI|nr:hypothetical protein Pcinc_034014 [Petrolisthes cinctipes]
MVEGCVGGGPGISHLVLQMETDDQREDLRRHVTCTKDGGFKRHRITLPVSKPRLDPGCREGRSRGPTER